MSDKTAEKDKNETSDLGSLEEDDEFEEFPAEEWSAADKEPEIFWEENWDDDNIEDDFSKQLRSVLEQTGQMK
ncbi:26S proteasome complex subunit SEM1-like [Ciona intestinalis]